MGTAKDGTHVRLRDEDRGNLHVLGSPRQGKSKLLEYLLRNDIDQGNGATLLDPSQNGETAFKVLRYACKVGYEKVLYVNPHDFFSSERVPPINPIHYKAPAKAVASNINDVLRNVWEQSSFASTSRIQKYLPALIECLHATGNDFLRTKNKYNGPVCTLVEAGAFIDRDSDQDRREIILSAVSRYSDAHKYLTSAFKSAKQWEGFLPTVNRINPTRDPRMRLMLGSQAGINFAKLVKEKYLVVVNLDPTGIWDMDQQAFLGGLILNELQYVISRLRQHPNPEKHWEGKHYVYIDECALFATRRFADSLYYKPKTGLIYTFAHHSFDQFKDDPYILSAIRNASLIKALFWVGSSSDRQAMLRDLGYGGELSDREVAYALSQTEKRNCAWRNNKQPPKLFRMKDVPDISEKELPTKVFKDYIIKLYRQDFYRDVEAVKAEIKQRFASPTPKSFRRNKAEPRPTQSDPNVPATDAVSDDKATRATDAGKRRWQDIKTPFDKEPG